MSSVVAPYLPPAAIAIERTSNAYWLRRDHGELWFEARGFDPLDTDWSRLATGAAWIASAGDSIAVLEDDTVTAFTAVAARPWFTAPGLAAALAGALGAVIDPIRRRVYLALTDSIVALDATSTTSIADVAARALVLSSDRRRLYAATATTITCLTLDTGDVATVCTLPPTTIIGALASSPGGLAATALTPTGASLLGIDVRHGACRILCPLPAELATAPLVADHTGSLTLAAPDRLYRATFDGSGLAVCFTPPG